MKLKIRYVHTVVLKYAFDGSIQNANSVLGNEAKKAKANAYRFQAKDPATSSVNDPCRRQNYRSSLFFFYIKNVPKMFTI